MSRNLTRWKAITLGLTLLAAVGLGAFALVTLGGWLSGGYVEYLAGFEDVRGIEPGSKVLLRGIQAGEVAAVEQGGEDGPPVILRLRIKNAHRRDLRNGATARITDISMLGHKAIEVRPPLLAQGKKLSELPLLPPGSMLPTEPQREISEVLAGKVTEALKELLKGEGTVGKLLSDPRAYEALLTLLESGLSTTERGKEALATLQRDAEALKKVPFLGGYVEDPTAILVRANCERNRRVFAEVELFEPGRAVLTAKGKEALDELGPWLTSLRHPGSDVVVVAYSDPKSGEGPTPLAVTRQQSEAVASYLKEKHRAHKMGGWGWFSGNRKVTPLGMGSNRPPQPESAAAPPARVEVLVFVPQK